MPEEALHATTFSRPRQMARMVRDKLSHAKLICREEGVRRLDAGVEDYHPQQSVLKPHAAQRQTACMRYMSPLHRSQSILSSWGTGVGDVPSAEGIFSGVARGRGSGGSGMTAIICNQSPGRALLAIGKNGGAA